MYDAKVHRILGRIEGQVKELQESVIRNHKETGERLNRYSGRLRGVEYKIYAAWTTFGLLAAGLAAAAHIDKLF